MAEPSKKSIDFQPFSPRRLAILVGPCDAHLRYIESTLSVNLYLRAQHCEIEGEEESVRVAHKVLDFLYQEAQHSDIDIPLVHSTLQRYRKNLPAEEMPSAGPPSSKKGFPEGIPAKHGFIRARNETQKAYLEAIEHHDIHFGIGPAGTGKTFLAVAAAVSALEKKRVQRIILVRPAVEAGERLGFLPGDFSQKIDPYLKPLYDALHTIVGPERVAKYHERGALEIAPLAYMRGRTLNDAFVILDEAQNATREQMKMFLTRLGFGGKMVVTGDMTQIDLPRGKDSGLRHALHVLRHTDKIKATFFDASDVVRHPLVEAVVRAYDQDEASSDS